VRPATDLAAYLGGFVAGEGTFTSSGTPPVFRFAVGLGATDRVSCETLSTYFGCGRIQFSPRRKPHYDDETTFVVSSLVDHLQVTIPFMDEHLPESYKRIQYLDWRAQLFHYWEHRARRRRPCSVDGCDAPRRAHGYCRHHLWLLRRE
jgi:hypothetical protein